ncbi:hypothetical protein ACFY30_10145 [Streptomyces sp. NPDC000345]|uniref:hypothetical protein n=1 Tax=Streptomyces sp. NPDC000345 TaxID=3364537 RepID=UPI0036C65C4F
MPYARAARALLLTLPLLVAAGPATAAGWSAAPSGGGRPSFYAEGAPGSVLQDTVAVTNRGTRPLTVRLRGTGLGGLPVAFADSAVRVPARTRAEVPFTVTVPADAAPGARTGAVVVREATGRRVTVRLLVRVGGPRLTALTVEHVAVHGDRITYELVNRGTTNLVPRLAVRADGVLGTVLDRAPRTLPVRLPPGRRLKLDEPWPDRPALDAVTVRLTVTAPGAAQATGHASARFVPWGAAGAAGGVLSLATGAVVVVRRRGSRRGDRAEAAGPGTRTSSEGMAGHASARFVPWGAAGAGSLLSVAAGAAGGALSVVAGAAVVVRRHRTRPVGRAAAGASGASSSSGGSAGGARLPYARAGSRGDTSDASTPSAPHPHGPDPFPRPCPVPAPVCDPTGAAGPGREADSRGAGT